MKGLVKAFVKEYPHIEGHRQIKPLLESLVGSHHGGQLPYWKVLIEQMMNKGLLEAIFFHFDGGCRRQFSGEVGGSLPE